MVSSVSFCPNLTLNPWTLLFPFLMQLFKTVNHDVIHDFCKYFAFILPSVLLAKDTRNLFLRYNSCSSLQWYYSIVVI